MGNAGAIRFFSRGPASDIPSSFRKDFSDGLRRLELQGIPARAARGVYVNPLARSKTDLLERIALTLWRGTYSYVSLETALGDYSIVFQQTIACITVMTTGRKGRFETPYGSIEFRHAARHISKILDGTVDVGRPLRLARPRLALEDLRRIGRKLELVDTEELEIMEEEMGRTNWQAAISGNSRGGPKVHMGSTASSGSSKRKSYIATSFYRLHAPGFLETRYSAAALLCDFATAGNG